MIDSYSSQRWINRVLRKYDVRATFARHWWMGSYMRLVAPYVYRLGRDDL